ncbi:putative bifunctional diguanylate cyclase/phosphodiesterase [Demequina lignilytica]|uniref:Bifunctional diguanylate cyclase/phosphodiesterase n=1 Tax=Demequina lignilytica TaxID=3051663 RepID=A0AAW7M4X2_9MICO|nr:MULTISPECIES: bifunctional diguanylate cyclase/phosphodiesterase [unclassified Demequina]MDN4477908.1 bifunctional diguanylate cyclase/phosphodiesterase [Demequina sp. SYSU T00039-1]MDN4484295.1 bifunctional diguanylate cyclase/phosphodiesterase [Demequina sp. SYSU T0a273]MDN4487817.1 bifunctional diguanylate cyclase/phosphodiesterase [Demequina sp. SYSU T00039]MDN4490800.1 bifunctional diguanylate cyclase/phosphodiesterase [Demequina sp. SYSU T00068]
MELTPAVGEDGARDSRPGPSSALDAYVAAVTALGLVGIVAVTVLTPWSDVFSQVVLWPALVLAVGAIIGEVRPVRLVRDTSEVRTLSTSAPFVLALLAVAGGGIAVVVQAIASLTDDALSKRPLKKSLFNTAQYALSVMAARAVFAALTGVPFFGGPAAVHGSDILALLVAGAVMVAVNWVLVAGVISLAFRERFLTVLSEEKGFTLLIHAVLVSIGGIAAVVADDGVLALILLVAPVVAAHLSATVAARYAHDAAHDPLTNLRNRTQLQRTLDRVLARHDKTRPETSLVMLDLDHFKDVNDTLGHGVGDHILVSVAERLEAGVPGDSPVYRIGGDEYAVVVEGGVDAAQRVARDLLAALDEPLHTDELDLLMRASVGVATAPEHGDTREELMKHAEIALYHAKVERDRVSTYAPELDRRTVDRLRLLADLRAAFEAQELHVVYQPQVELASGKVVAAEALVRWTHPTRGLVPTDDFIALAESSGLIVPLTAFVLDTSLAQAAAWHAEGHRIRIAVNLSARHLSDLDLPDQVAAALARHDFPPGALVLEVTETGILTDPFRAEVVVRALRGQGVEISIDDYGTGNSSLTHLKRLRVDELKIDRSFVSNVVRDSHDHAIARSTVALATALGLRVVAEGIEDQATAEALSALGCGIGQGYHLGRPELAEVLTARLEGAAVPGEGA